MRTLGAGLQYGRGMWVRNIRATYMRVRKPRPNAPIGNYGGAELQLMLSRLTRAPDCSLGIRPTASRPL